MHDIFSTYSKDYEKVDHALAEQLSKCISYKILSVQEDQAEKSATATLSITSLDMERVLKTLSGSSDTLCGYLKVTPCLFQ